MGQRSKTTEQPCKLFKMLQNKVPDFCGRHFIPKVEWQKFCNNDKRCHDAYWAIVYNEKKILNQRLERLEKEAGFTE